MRRVNKQDWHETNQNDVKQMATVVNEQARGNANTSSNVLERRVDRQGRHSLLLTHQRTVLVKRDTRDELSAVD